MKRVTHDTRPGELVMLASDSHVWKRTISGLGDYVATPRIAVYIQDLTIDLLGRKRCEILLNGEKWLTMSCNLKRVR